MLRLCSATFMANSAAKMDTRHRKGDDQRGARRAQEQSQHGNRQDHAGASRDLQVVQGVGNQACVVRDLVNVDAGQIFVQAFQRLAHFR